ncbi:MAG: D-aminoacylase [Planctomycetes bacterium]|nr:D-aminoacylase [Planctomycetota bacterium]
MFDLLITNGRVVDGSGLPWFRADVGITGDRITAIGRFPNAEARQRIDAKDSVVAPGMIDAHVHGDLVLLADAPHEPAVRQGVTTYIIGQDGVAMAPASAPTLEYMRRYTAGFNGNFPTPGMQWSSLDEYLNQFKGRSSINAACLIPNGNLRMDVMGLETRVPTAKELDEMRRMVREAMEQGAVGFSTGLDYIPSRYAETEELIELCKEITPFGGVYVTHMRAYSPEKVIEAMDEVERIGKESGCAVHISHFNSLADQVIPKLDSMRAAGVDVTFDLYCYLYGSTILGMIALPPEVQIGGIEPTLKRLADPATREKLKPWFAAPRVPLENVRLGSVPAAEYRNLEGETLEAAAKLTGKSIGDLVCDLLLATGMATNCVVRHNARRQEEDITKLMRHPSMMSGSDGIYIGGKPHPRGTGCFAKYIGHYVRNGTWPLEEAIMKSSYHVARRHGLGDRGLVREGMAADVIIFDPATINDRSTFDDGKSLATGMEHVIVNGQLVLHNGSRTANRPGRGLRRS